jgi:hypothetical protein
MDTCSIDRTQGLTDQSLLVIVLASMIQGARTLILTSLDNGRLALRSVGV